jgi:cysteinyl-tRNA synthetase
MKLFLTSTMSGKKELFVPLQQKKVSLYVCGITPYDYSHMGHGRVYVIFDLLFRLLTFLGYEVTYCRNFTDIDDKIIDKAAHELGNRALYLEIANRFIAAYHADMAALGCLKPSHEPRVTQTIPEIITFIEGLIVAKKAYVVAGDVYFDITSFPSYGALSKRKLDELQAGARVEVNTLKKNPLDFALWKGEAEGQFWKSPWGYGRPGWHIECSAMAEKFLGRSIDIHGGGMDLIFPHHENEIAQSQGLHDGTFVRYWMHNAFITIDKEKMSKSLGNFFTLRDIFKKFDPMVVRYYFLNHLYRAPLEFSFDLLAVAQKGYQRLAKIFSAHNCSNCGDNLTTITQSPIASQMIDLLCDDLNTVALFGVLFENIAVLQRDEMELCRVKKVLTHLLGLSLVPLPEHEIEITPEIEALLADREKARAEKDWKKADMIRDRLKELGYEVRDKKS